jgi:hypothetical protein
VTAFFQKNSPPCGGADNRSKAGVEDGFQAGAFFCARLFSLFVLVGIFALRRIFIAARSCARD